VAAQRTGAMSVWWRWRLLPLVAAATFSVGATALAGVLASSPVAAALLTALLVGLAGLVPAELARRRLAHLRDLTLTDPTTQLSNRRCLSVRLRQELRRAHAVGRPLALLLLDLDELKAINDRHGHLAGDAALCAVARAVRCCCRAQDLAVRFGGDEFVVLMADTTAHQARALAERIRAELRRHPLAGGGAPTVSIGIVDTNLVPTLRSDPFLRAADLALYTAKQRGRDQVLIAPVAASADRRLAPSPIENSHSPQLM
jgi:diguanylate cyclase (GGDEF)-like protein